MSPNEQREEAVFEAALQLPAGQRAAYLDQTCAGDADLRRRVEVLLGAFERAGGFMKQPASPERTGRFPLPPAEKPGDRIGRYKLLQQIGEGGCGVVYMAEQEEPVRRRVALKVIKLGMDTKLVIARFEAERQALAMMDHPNIARVLDAGATDTGRPYFVMELVRGIKITAYCDQNHLSTKERLDLFVQVCRAIQHAHQKGVIHRDIKPSNILVASNDGVPVPKVIDFGIAKATQGRLTDQTVFTAFDQFIGTPAYMSPEQAELTMLDIDTRTDIYSLGVLLYELLTGKTPFEAKDLVAAGLDAMRRMIREVEPVKPSTRLTQELAEAAEWESDKLGKATAPAVESHSPTFPPTHFRPGPRHDVRELQRLIPALRGDLDWIVMKALEKDRARRYETANGLAADIIRHVHDEPVVARPPSRVYEFQKTVRRHKFGFAAAAAIILLLAGGITLTTWQAVRATRAERAQNHLRAEAEEARQTAQTQANRAEAAAVDLKMTLSASDFWQGVRLVDQDNAVDALPFLARCLSANPTNDAALTRLTTLLTGRSWLRPVMTLKHSGVIDSAEFSPDGKRIVVSSGHIVREWDAETGELLSGPEEALPAEPGLVKPGDVTTGEVARASREGDKKGNVYSVNIVGYVNTPDGETKVFEYKAAKDHLSPDRKSVVKANGHSAQVWDAQSGAALAPPMKHYAPVSDTDFSPDGRRIVTASADYTARVWDAHTGQPLTEPMKHDRAVVSANFSPDGRRILTIAEDHTVRIWDAQTGQPLVTLMKQVYSARFSPDGKRIVTASRDRTTCIWDVQTGRPLTESVRNVMRSASFSPDGKRILTAPGDNTVCVWDAQIARPLVEWLTYKGSVASIQFSPDGKRIVTASSDRTARVWDAQTHQPLAEPMKHSSRVDSARFSPDGKWIVTVSASAVRVWDAQTSQPLVEPMKHRASVNSAEFSPDGKRIVTASADETARIWDAQTGQPLTEPMKHPAKRLSAHFSPDGNHIVTAADDGTARVWDANTGQPLGEPMKGPADHTSAQFSPDGKRILTASADTAHVSDWQTGQSVTALIKHDADIRDAHFSPDGRQIVTASADFTARVWDAQTGQPLTEPMKHKAEVSSARFSPDGKRIVTTSQDSTARVWDARTAQPLTDPLNHPEGGVEKAEFSPDGRQIVTKAGGVVRVWDVAPAQRGCPRWLLTLAEAISGQVLNQQGVLEPTRLNRPQALSQIREQLKRQPGDDDWMVWGRWFFADHATRTISPFSKTTVPEYVNRRIEENTLGSLQEATQLSPTNSLAFARLALLVANQDLRRHPAGLENAESHARLAVKLDPDNSAAWQALGAVQARQGRPVEALASIDRALELQPGNAQAWEVKGDVLEHTDRLAEALAAYTRQVESRPAGTNQEAQGGRSALLNRARVFRQLERWEEAGRDVCLAYGVPRREARDLPNLVDLSAFYNAGFKGNWDNDQSDNDLSELPVGIQELAGTRFDLRGLIQLCGDKTPDSRGPAQVPGLPIARKCRRVHFLHGAIRANAPTGTVIGSYVFHYPDGTTQERPLVLGNDVLDWWKEPPESAADDGLTVAWTGQNGKSRDQGRTIQLYKTTWENPTPEVQIASIDFISARKNTVPFLVAITVE